MWVWVFAAAFAGKWDGATSDIVVSQEVSASPEAVQALLVDWHGWKGVVPGDCAEDWVILEDRTGIGARSTTTWAFGPMRRRLEGVITKDEPGRLVETELAGRNGWFTQAKFAAADSGKTLVTLTSPVTQPSWPFTGVYFSKIKPAWEACYTETLKNIGAKLGS